MIKVPEYKKDKKTIRLISFNLFIFFIAIYLLTASGLNFYNTDASQLRFEVTRSIVEDRDVTITQGVVGLIGADGRKYAWVGIGSSILSVPFYMIGKVLGIPPENTVSFMNQLFGAATIIIIFMFLISLGYTKHASLLVSVFYGLGTIAWPLTKQPFDHTTETFFILLSIYCMYLYVNRGKFSNLIFSACSLGFAFITRQTSIFIMPPLFILMLISVSREYDFKASLRLMIKNVILFSLSLLPFLGLFFWYNYYRFGSIFETGYQLVAERSGLDFFTGTPLLTGLSGLLISPGKGYFYYSPIAVLFFFSISSFIRKHLWLGISFIFIIISYLLFLSKNIYWHGDMAWGPRYIFALTTLFVIPIAEIFESDIWRKKKILRRVVYCIFVVSFIVQIAAVSVDFLYYFSDLQFNKKVNFNRVPGDGFMIVVTPPRETYFMWGRSPIPAQFRFIYEISGKMKYYKYSENIHDTAAIDRYKLTPGMNVYDFWWLYKYFIYGAYSGFFIAAVLILLVVLSGIRLYKLTR